MRSRLLAPGFLVLLLAIPARAADEPKTQVEEVVPGKVRLAIDPGYPSSAYIVSFAPDSRTLYTAGMDGTLQVWNVENGERLRVIRSPLGMKDIFFAPFEPLPDGRRIAINGGMYYDLRLHPPGLLDLETGAVTPLPAVPAGTKASAEVKVSPDGKYLAGFQGPKGVLLWKLDPTEEPVQLGIGNSTASYVRFSQDGRLAVSCSDGRVRLRDLKDGVRALPPLEHDAEVRSIVWLPDGKHLLAESKQALHYWDVDAGRLLRTWTAKDEKYNFGPTCARATSVYFYNLSCSRKGTRVLAAWGGKVDGNYVAGGTVLDVATGEVQEARLIEEGEHGLIWGDISPDGKYAVLVRGWKIDLWPLDRPADVRHLWLNNKNDDWRLSGWGADNRTIAWDGAKTRGVLSHALDLAELALRSGNEAIPGVALSSLELRGWKLTRIKNPKDPKVNAFEVEHNGVKLPDLSVKYTGWALLLANGKDDVLLACMDEGDLNTNIGLYDPVKGRVGTISGRGTGFKPLAGSPDGRYLLTYGGKGNLEIYSVGGRKRLLSVYVQGEEWIVWTDAGYYAASPGGERLMGWVVQEEPNKIPTFHPAARFHKQMYRPDIIKLVLETGDVKAAIEQANRTAKKASAELPKLLPPFVEMELDKTKLPAEVTVRAVARAAVADQPVTALQLLLDGRPGPEVTFKDPVKMGEKATAQWTVKLPPGPHQLHVLARSPDSMSLSSAAQVTGPTAAVRSKLHTLCVGVTSYANNGKGVENAGLNLKYPADDARLMDRVLRDCCAETLFEPGQSVVLTDRHATRDAVRSSLKCLQKRAEPGDLVVVHFSCHGEKAENGSLFLLLHEADRRDLRKTCLSGAELKEALAKIPCRVLLLLDACHSSAIGPPYRVTTELAMLLNDEDCGAAVIAAACSKEFALEDVKDRDTGKDIENGLFTWAIKKGLASKAKADERDHRVYIHDLYQYVFSEVRYQSNGRQTPCLGAPLGGKPVALIERSPTTPGDRK